MSHLHHQIRPDERVVVVVVVYEQETWRRWDVSVCRRIFKKREERPWPGLHLRCEVCGLQSGNLVAIKSSNFSNPVLRIYNLVIAS